MDFGKNLATAVLAVSLGAFGLAGCGSEGIEGPEAETKQQASACPVEYKDRPVFIDREVEKTNYLVPFFGGAENFAIKKEDYARVMDRLTKEMYRASPDGRTLTAKSERELYGIFDKMDGDGTRDSNGSRDISTEQVDSYLGVR